MSSTRIDVFEIDVPGGKVHAKRWMPAIESRKSPIILLHDSLGSVDSWRSFPEELARSLSRPVVAYDRLGFGRSEARHSLPTVRFIEEEATIYFPAIKDKLSLRGYILLGHSVGGGMAINIAARDSDCQAVVTVAAQAFVEDITLESIEQARQAFQRPGQIERLEKWHGPKARWVLRAWTEVWLSDGFKDWSLEPVIRDVKCPVLAIHGDKDEYGSSAFPKFIAENAGGPASMLMIEDCGHVPHRERLHEVIDALQSFLHGID